MLGLSDEVKEHASFMQRCHMHTNHCSDNSTCTMSYDQTCPLPQVFFVNEGGGVQRPIPSSNLVPCWSFPQPRERTRSQQRNRGCMGVSSGAALVVLMLFLLVFATLGFEAYQIQNLQKKLKAMQEVRDGWLGGWESLQPVTLLQVYQRAVEECDSKKCKVRHCVFDF